LVKKDPKFLTKFKNFDQNPIFLPKFNLKKMRSDRFVKVASAEEKGLWKKEGSRRTKPRNELQR
jgi:hypothetical protein